MRIYPKQLLLLAFAIAMVSLGSSSIKPNASGSISGVALPAEVKHPAWSKNVSIYEINVRQFTPEGTFKALEAHLPRLKELGTDLLWLMPIHPIGELNRKGTLGSYYAVKDYTAVNPDYGTPEDFRHFVNKAHKLGMYVIIDWVANHSAWDNDLVTSHPDWYVKDSTGKLLSPFDWTDVVKFDYNNREMRNYMSEAMKYWIEEFNIDGYRCDVAGEVPTDFWIQTRHELDSLKPVFMLAEAEDPAIHQAFDMTYAWEFHHIMNKIYKGEMNANDVEKYLIKNDTTYPADAYRMNFITNHDENSWNGSESERLGEGVKAFYVLTVCVPCMPLVYTGQESGMQKRLEFFEKDPVEWGDYSMTGFYKTILGLKKQNTALYNGLAGGDWSRVYTTADDKVFAILRNREPNRAFSVVNLSGSPVTFTLQGDAYAGSYKELFSGTDATLKADESMELPAWGYKVYYK